MRIIGVLRAAGVYQANNDVVYDAALEHAGKESRYRKYLGKGMEKRSLLKKIRDIVDVFDGTAKILVYFSGIGSKDAASKESYLLPSDAALNTLKTTGYSVNKLTEELGKMNSKQTVVIIDAPMCGTNRLGQALVANRGVSIVPKSGTPQGNVVLSMASSTGIPAYAVRKYGHGLFTYGILSKLQETKGNCTIKDVTDAASLWVKKTTLGLYKKTQAPIIIPSQNLAGSWATLKF